MSDNQTARVAAVSVKDFARWAGIGLTTAWKEIREGRLRAVKVSQRTIIILDDAQRWLETRPALQPRSARNVPTSGSSEGANARPE